MILPDDAEVRWAGLYWGARLGAGTGGVDAVGNGRQMKLRAPGDAAYRTITAGRLFGPTSTADRAYQAFADVTSIVQAAGPGMYFGADVPAATGEDRYAGWSLVVVYRSPSLPLRNLTVFDGLADVGQGDPQIDHDQRVHDARSPAPSTPGSGSSPTRATTGRAATGRSCEAPPTRTGRCWPRRCRRARTSSTAPTTTTARWSRAANAGRPQHARVRHQELRRARHPRQQRDVGDDRPRQHERALLPRRRHDGDRRVRPGLLAVDEDGHQPDRRRPGPGRRHPSLHGHVRQRRPGPGDQHVDRRPDPRRHVVRARVRSTSRPA